MSSAGETQRAPTGAVGLLLGGVLTEYLDWRWCLYVNVPIAVVALIGGLALLHNQHEDGPRHRLDVPGAVTVSAGLFGLVYGFANAETHEWGDVMVWGWLVAGVVLLAGFLAIESRVSHPLIPLRVMFDRTRGGSLVAILVLGIGIFALFLFLFLFLTFYLQQNLGFSPIPSGVAFLPMIGALALAATTSTSVVLPRVGPRPVVPLGLGSTYAGDVLGPLIVIGIGVGLSMAPAMSAGTSGVHASDAGVASALVNTAQQVGGSIGTAVLSTIAADAASDYLADRVPSPAAVAAASIESYTTTFTWVAVFLVFGAVLAVLLLRSGPLAVDPDAPPSAHM